MKRMIDARELFDAVHKQAEDQGGVDFAPLTLFLQIIDMAQGAFVLAEAMCLRAAHPLMRTMWECYVSLQYIIGLRDIDSNDWHRRSLAYLVFCLNKEIAVKQMIDPSTGRGKDFQSQLKAHCGSVGRAVCASLEANQARYGVVEVLQARLRESDLVEFQKGYLANNPNYFFRLVDPKIKNIEELARTVGLWADYKVWYGQLSRAVHGTDALRLLKDGGHGTVVFDSGSTPDEQTTCAEFTEYILHFAGKIFCRHYAQILTDSRPIVE